MSENREKILEQIKEQGEIVRKLKAAKEPKDKVSHNHFLDFPCLLIKIVGFPGNCLKLGLILVGSTRKTQ
jgi:hypothetical protein